MKKASLQTVKVKAVNMTELKAIENALKPFSLFLENVYITCGRYDATFSKKQYYAVTDFIKENHIK